MTGREIAILFVEDSESDVKLAIHALQRDGLTAVWERVEDKAKLVEALGRRTWDLVISDSSISHLPALEALTTARELTPATPFVVLSGTLSESAESGFLRAGTAAFVSKTDLRQLSAIVARELARAEAQRQTIAHLLLAAQEAEARRIARDLHDRLGQLLIALVRALQNTDHREAHALAEQAIQQTREVSTELWPAILDDLGLPSALRWLGERYQGRLATAFVDADDVGRLPREIESACYRIVQEALTNAARHANARVVVVRLRQLHAAIELAIYDDGCGFDPEVAWRRAAGGASLGLLAMRERTTLANGTFTLESKPGAGTTIRARIPVAQCGAS